MPILDLEHRLREVGRIRLGDRVEAIAAVVLALGDRHDHDSWPIHEPREGER